MSIVPLISTAPPWGGATNRGIKTMAKYERRFANNTITADELYKLSDSGDADARYVLGRWMHETGEYFGGLTGLQWLEAAGAVGHKQACQYLSRECAESFEIYDICKRLMGGRGVHLPTAEERAPPTRRPDRLR